MSKNLLLCFACAFSSMHFANLHCAEELHLGGPDDLPFVAAAGANIEDQAGQANVLVAQAGDNIAAAADQANAPVAQVVNNLAAAGPFGDQQNQENRTDIARRAIQMGCTNLMNNILPAVASVREGLANLGNTAANNQRNRAEAYDALCPDEMCCCVFSSVLVIFLLTAGFALA
ncbi:MAG: hypothetical protein LBJ89_02680 [Holosporales bacterium]|jgi:hypothetical protein|nr:hypothetical protein [Holosporales bacterium]